MMFTHDNVIVKLYFVCKLKRHTGEKHMNNILTMSKICISSSEKLLPENTATIKVLPLARQLDLVTFLF